LSCALSNAATMFLSVVKGMQRMDKSNSLEIKIALLNAIGTVVFLESGWGIFGLAVNALINVCCGLALTWWAVRKIMPSIRLKWRFDGKLLREMFTYGIKLQVSQVGSWLCFRVDKLIVSRFLGTVSVSFYEVSSRLTSFMRALPLVMISALIPATSELGARNDRAKIVQTYLLASKYVAMLTVAMVAFLAMEARSVLTLWLGTGFENSVILVQILAIGYGANVLGGVESQTGAGVGRPEFDMRSTVLLGILNPILCIILVQKFGAAGAAAGTTCAFVIATTYLLISFHRHYIKNSAGAILRHVYIGPICVGIVADVAVLGFHQVTPQLVTWESIRYLAPVKMAADFGIFAPVYVLLLVAFRQVTSIDWKNLTGVLSFGFEFLRQPLRQRVKIYR
jgi:O-antigen/teichoic acid export membrane protein